jgi:hypothetical protein
MLRAGRPVLIPGRGKIFFSPSLPRPDVFWGSSQSLIQCIPGALSPVVKRLGREANHTPTSSADVNNTWAIPQG